MAYIGPKSGYVSAPADQLSPRHCSVNSRVPKCVWGNREDLVPNLFVIHWKMSFPLTCPSPTNSQTHVWSCLTHFALWIYIISWSYTPYNWALVHMAFLLKTCVVCLVKKVRIITKTRLYNFDPLKPHFYIVKQGFTGVYIIFLILLKNIDCRYSLEPPRRGGSHEYPQSMFWAEIWKISEYFIWKFSFFGGKIFSIFE